MKYYNWHVNCNITNMKKLILLSALIFISCSKDDIETNCSCNAYFERGTTIVKEWVEIDCETRQPLTVDVTRNFIECDK